MQRLERLCRWRRRGRGRDRGGDGKMKYQKYLTVLQMAIGVTASNRGSLMPLKRKLWWVGTAGGRLCGRAGTGGRRPRSAVRVRCGPGAAARTSGRDVPGAGGGGRLRAPGGSCPRLSAGTALARHPTVRGRGREGAAPAVRGTPPGGPEPEPAVPCLPPGRWAGRRCGPRCGGVRLRC